MRPANLPGLCRLVRHHILTSTTAAGSGHPTSSLSAVELMVGLMFSGVFRFDADHPENPNNDRLIFSKGHASPLFYSLWAAAGKISEQELMTMRKFGSRLEGHPVPKLPYVECATGSLGQGLSVGVGMALNAKVDSLPYRTYVLLGDSEMSEGSVWEALQLAAHYQLDNLVGILDVNRLGQRGPTMYGHKVNEYVKRVAAFGWQTINIDGHKLSAVAAAYQRAARVQGRPTMIIAKTVKGKGVSLVADREGWHGMALKPEQLEPALKELGPVDKSLRGEIAKPEKIQNAKIKMQHDNAKLKNSVTDNLQLTTYNSAKPTATRQAYGNALVRIFPHHPEMVVLDAEVSNSTYSEIFAKTNPQRYFEMFIAEQNMVGTALGLSRRGKLPFVSTFACFLARAFDQIRLCQYSEANIKFCGSHAGVSIGEDGPSQMALEDLAMFRTLLNSVVLYPCDAISTEKLVEEMANHRGIAYLRTTRMATPILYQPTDEFPIGGSKVLKSSSNDVVTVVGAGVTVVEALKAYTELQKQGIKIRVIDCYSIKPLDVDTLKQAAKETKAIITVEDHFAEGGLGEAVAAALADQPTPIHILAVRKQPTSGQPQELLDFEGISAQAIAQAVHATKRKRP